MKERQKYLFVINPAAGGIDKSYLVDRLEQMEWAQPPSIIWTDTSTAHIFKQELESASWDAVVAVGGDGTVHMVAEALVGTQIPLAILPMGSGNGLAKDLDLPMDIEDALQLALEGQAKPVDAVRFNNQLSFHICDAGLNAHVVMQYGLSKQRTLRAYAWQLLKFYFSAGPQQVTVWVDGQEVYHGPSFLVALCNGRRYGSDLLINPAGRVDDGRMEVVILHSFDKTDGPRILLELMNGERDPAYFSLFSGQHFRMEAASLWPWQSDGEYLGEARSFEGEILPSALWVIRP